MSKADTLPVLVTGASRGLGYALALALAGSGRAVIATARTQGGLEELDDAIAARGGQAVLAPADLTDDMACQQLCRAIHDRWGGLSLWVHTAIHAAPLTPAQMIQPKDWTASVAVNIEATRRLIAYVAPLLGSAGSAWFFDDPERPGTPFFGTYGATKAAQMALVRSWAAETRRIGPEVRIFAPAPMATALRARFHPGEDRTPLLSVHAAAASILDEAGLVRAVS